MPVEIPRVITDVKTAFNKSQIVSNLGRMERHALSRAGGYVAETARRSIRKRPGTSKPGEQPYSHTGKLRDLIRSGIDSNRICAVAGVLPRFDVESQGLAPSALEHGGRTVYRPSKGKKYRPGDTGILEIGHGKSRIKMENGEEVNVTFGKIETPAQLARANANLMKVRGVGDKPKTVFIAARPFMSTALIQASPALQSFFRNF